MKRTRDAVILASCTAILIGAQLVLSGVAGLEIVSAIFISFAFSLGVARGCTVATLFSLVRCFVFGFHLNVLVLYLIYFNSVALFFGFLGRRKFTKSNLVLTIIVVIFALLFTVGFTFLDVLITSVMYGFNSSGLSAYLAASLMTMLVHLLSVAVSVSVLFLPLTKVLDRIK